MGCFLRCFGGEKDRRRCKRRAKRASPQILRKRVEKVHHESISTAELRNVSNELVEEEKMSHSPRKVVTFNPSITTYEHVLVKESIDSLPDCNGDAVRENQEESKSTSLLCSLSEDDRPVIASVRLYPPNHRYYNAIGSDDEAEEYGDSDLDDFDELNDEDDYDDYNEHIDNELISKSKSNHLQNENHETAIDASLSTWLVSPEIMLEKNTVSQ